MILGLDSVHWAKKVDDKLCLRRGTLRDFTHYQGYCLFNLFNSKGLLWTSPWTSADLVPTELDLI